MQRPPEPPDSNSLSPARARRHHLDLFVIVKTNDDITESLLWRSFIRLNDDADALIHLRSFSTPFFFHFCTLHSVLVCAVHNCLCVFLHCLLHFDFVCLISSLIYFYNGVMRITSFIFVVNLFTFTLFVFQGFSVSLLPRFYLS